MSLGIGIAPREFECTLCGQPFTQLTGDLVLYEHLLCATCLEELWELEGEALGRRVTERLVERTSGPEGLPHWRGSLDDLARGIVRFVQDAREHGASLDQMLPGSQMEALLGGVPRSTEDRDPT